MVREKVIYDERIPKIKEQRRRRTNRRLIFLSTVFFAVLAVVLYSQSPYADLTSVSVNGNHLLSEEEVLETAGISRGMSYFNISTRQAEQQLEQLIEIESAAVTRTFPNGLELQLQENTIVAFWMDEEHLYPVLPSGHVLTDRPHQTGRLDAPILSDWPDKDGLKEFSQELDRLPNSVARHISEIKLTPIYSDPYRLTLYMVDGYEVRTTIRQFADHMSWYPELLSQAHAEGMEEAIFYLLEGKWLVAPTDSTDDANE